MKVNINKKEVKKIGVQLIENSTSLSNEVKKITAIFDKLSICWTSDDFKKLEEDFMGVYLPNLQRLSDRWESYGEYLKLMSDPYDEIEKAFINSMK